MIRKLLTATVLLTISGSAKAALDAIIMNDSDGNPVTIEHVADEWVKINEFEKKEFWVRTKNIESEKLNDSKDLRRMFGMIRLTDGDKKVPGVGEGVRRIYSEAVVNCVDGAIVPVRDFYTDDLGTVIRAYRHRLGRGMMMSKREPGTMGHAIYTISCLDKMPDVK